MKSISGCRLAGLLWAFVLAAFSSATVTAGGTGSMRYTDHPLSGRIYDTARDVFIDESALLERLKEFRLVLVGEKHDNDEHHRIEQRILRRLVDQDTRVVFEMMDESQQPLIGTLERGDSPEVMREKLAWPERRWPWADYGPLIRTVLEQDGAIVAGNIDLKRFPALHGGDFEWPEDDPRFASRHVLDDAGQEAIREQLYVSHCKLIPRKSLDPMLAVQIAWDAAMAHAMLDTGGEPSARSILVTGGYHTRRDLAVPAHITFRDPEAEMVIVLLREVDPALSDPADNEDLAAAGADYVWFTPAAPEKGYCAGLREKFRAG